MKLETIQDILPLIERPSHYIGGEINSVYKKSEQVQLRIALAFPDLYEIGTSHFGLQILYHILNQHPEISAERVYTPAEDMCAYLKSAGLSLMSLETHTALNRFDIIGFSLLYELNYTNILTMLDLAEIPFYAEERDMTHPLIIAGGPCACNPEPVADFFDAIVIGDGEEVLPEMTRIYLEWKQGSHRNDKTYLLHQWAATEGVYIPSFFTDGQQVNDGWKPEITALKPRYDAYSKIKRTIIADLDKAPFPTAAVIPFGKPVHDRLRLEISRGCTRGCRFCQAGMIYRPVRERNTETLIDLAEKSLSQTGYTDLSLLSLSTGDYSAIQPLMQQLMGRCASEHIAISLPSLRAGTLTPEMAKLVKTVRKTGFTIAPEAGSQRLRNVINKNITHTEIIDTVSTVFSLGWSLIKLYFMIGLPTETDEDLQAIIDLVLEIRKAARSAGKRNRRRGQITVSVGTFIPKPHTPFQWHPQITLEEAKRKIQWLKNELKRPGIQFKWQNPEISQIEGLFARGDRRLSRLLVHAYKHGCHLDGWSDRFRYDLWLDALHETGIDIGFYTTRARTMNEKLPWNHIDIRIDDNFLSEEWRRAQSETFTADCRDNACGNCGACATSDKSGKQILPRLCSSAKAAAQLPNSGEQLTNKNDSGSDYQKIQIYYQKCGPARYFGHLEMVNMFIRAIMRSSLKVKYSKGFHPKPKIAFNDTLPIGIESRNESFQIFLLGTVDAKTVIARLNAFLPKGLNVFKCRFNIVKTAPHTETTVRYSVTLRQDDFDAEALTHFLKTPTYVIHWTNRKGKTRHFDLKKIVTGIELTSSDHLNLEFQLKQGQVVRPYTVIDTIFKLSEVQIKQARIVKM
ncbi:TIGR03960 family B12-binding radical SAM protein [Desulfococcaceae bacterium HSG7]|nr:TIGR03960 family B12-binding radical SAM protein [Desulfococcaceae bacterium HSG7]